MIPLAKLFSNLIYLSSERHTFIADCRNKKHQDWVLALEEGFLLKRRILKEKWAVMWAF